jgi:invasion protein IalB
MRPLRLLLLALLLCPGPALAAVKQIYAAQHGNWLVDCSQQVMTDERFCTARTAAGGRGLIAETTVTIVFYSASSASLPVLLIRVPQMTLQNGLTFRLDGGGLLDIACATIEDDYCTLSEADAYEFYSAWRGGSELVLRAYGWDRAPYDFIFQLNGIEEALEDLASQSAQLL